MGIGFDFSAAAGSKRRLGVQATEKEAANVKLPMWQELFTDDKKPYYFNAETNVTSWEKPLPGQGLVQYAKVSSWLFSRLWSVVVGSIERALLVSMSVFFLCVGGYIGGHACVLDDDVCA